jgi:hypothetical protein
MWTRHKIVVAAAAVVATAGLVAGLLVGLHNDPQVRKASPPPLPMLSPPPMPSPSRPAQLRSPLTGERVRVLHRVLAVKIDNIVYARPQTGLTHADIVYVLPVEGGLSRFLAIFSSHFPPVIGPVRSARADDIQLLRQFGRPAFAYSGATASLLPWIHNHARIVNLYAGTAGGYYRGLFRIAPYNLYARTRQLLKQARGASRAHDIGFRFGPPPPGGRVTRSASVSYPAASFRFTWSAKKHRWLVWMDGRPAMTTGGGQLSPPTVVIQHTTQVRIPVVWRSAAVRGEHRLGHRGGAAGRQGMDHALVPPARQRRDHVHHHVRPADEVRTGPGLGRARVPISPVLRLVAELLIAAPLAVTKRVHGLRVGLFAPCSAWPDEQWRRLDPHSLVKVSSWHLASPDFYHDHGGPRASTS